MVYRCDKQTSKLAQQLKHFYTCGEFCDVILYSRTSQVHAHRLILAAFSPYFYHTIHRNTDRRNIAEIQLRSYDDRIVKAIVDFFYNGVITVDSDSAEQIFSLANTLQVKEVEKLCLTFLNAQQSFASEIEPDRKPILDGAIGRYNIEPSRVESSSRSSPRTSPSVSTSGRPLSDSGSVDSDVIKQEVQDYSFEDEYREYYREEKKKESEGRVKVAKTVVDMSHLEPKLSCPPASYSQQYMFVRPSPPPPPTLQMMAPQHNSSKSHDTDMSESGHASSSKDQTSGEDSNQDSSHADMEGISINLDNMLECQICKQMFESKHLLDIHVAGVHGLGNYKKRQRVSPGEVSADVDGALPCGTCGKHFRDAQSLKFHKYNHMLRFSCNVCGKRFSRSWNLHRHRKTHVRYSHMSSVLVDGDEDSMHAEYVDEISSDMVDLTSTGEEDTETSLNTSHDVDSPEKTDDDKTQDVPESKSSDQTSK